jgi:tetratricopeptide (TPR) repeat protein
VRRARTALLACAMAFLPGVASADTPPNAWEVAKDPAILARYRLHLEVQGKLIPALDEDEVHDRMVRGMLYESARSELEDASAATSPDPRLRYDLGEVYLRLDRFQQAIDVLKPALAMFPTGDGADAAWLDLAFAAAHLDQAKQERDAYDAFLKEAVRPRQELDILSNRAEAEMHLGHLEEAISGYRDVIERVEHARFGTQNDFKCLVLARWGLAVALDRSGDPTGAEREAFVATQEDPSERLIGDTVDVFFVPRYERDWYLALGRIQHAKHAQNARTALAYWDGAVDAWSDYVTQASKGDRWLALAKAHLTSAKDARKRASDRLAKEHKGAGGETRVEWPLDFRP